MGYGRREENGDRAESGWMEKVWNNLEREWKWNGEKRKGCGGKKVEEVRMRREHGERKRQRMEREKTEKEEEE